jgi:hypothetical protein
MKVLILRTTAHPRPKLIGVIKMTKITASQARQIAGPDVENHVNDAYQIIRKAAESGSFEVVLDDEFWGPTNWSSESGAWNSAASVLNDAGFKVGHKRGSGTVIKW